MRTTFFFAALLLVAALAALLVERHRSAPASAAATRGTATLVGDSLNVGVERYLPAALPHWKIVANDLVGRTTDEGIGELEADRPPLSPYVVVSLGTNDPADVVRLPADVARVLKLDRPEPVRDLGDDLAQRKAGRRVQRRPAYAAAIEPSPAAGRMGRDGSERTPTGSPATTCTATRLAIVSEPAQWPRRRDRARPP